MASFNPLTVYKALRANARSVVKYHHKDWKVDRQSLRKAKQNLSNGEISKVSFIHVSSEYGTHMWHVEYHKLDIRVPYLFGHCTPREKMRNIADIFSTESSSLSDESVIQLYDGKQVRLITKLLAREIFLSASTQKDSLPPNLCR